MRLISPDFYLQVGSMVDVNVVDCNLCVLVVETDTSNVRSFYSVSGSGEGTFIVPDSNPFKVVVTNFGSSADTLTSIVIVANVPQNSTQTELGYNNFTVAQFSVATLAPVLVLGILPSLAILSVIIVVVVVLVLLDRGIIVIATHHRKRR